MKQDEDEDRAESTQDESRRRMVQLQDASARRRDDPHAASDGEALQRFE